MGTMSVSVPERLKKEMNKLDEVNWSAVARKAFEEKVREISLLKKITSKSKLSKEDAIKIGKKINKGMAKKFKDI